MVESYKIIKDKGALKAGEFVNWVSKDECFTYEHEDSTDNYYSSITVRLTPNLINKYLSEGVIVPVNDEYNAEDEPCDCCNCDKCEAKLKELKRTLASLKNTYNQRAESVRKKYNDDKIPTCVKVEHDTVYFNLMKLIKHIEDILNHE